MGKPEKNWMEGAGKGSGDKNTPGPDEYYNGKSDADEGGNYSVPSHLAADSTLEKYITEVQGACQSDYDENYGPLYHEGDNYPSRGSKGNGGGMD